MDGRIMDVAMYMARKAYYTSEGKAVFKGSPRHYMEATGVSSGPLYEGLYALGFRRHGRGRSAIWEVPEDIMARVNGRKTE